MTMCVGFIHKGLEGVVVAPVIAYPATFMLKSQPDLSEGCVFALMADRYDVHH